MLNATPTTAPKITIIDPVIKLNPLEAALDEHRKLKVAAYARVSTEQDEQQNSYQTQMRYYFNHIKSNPDWEFVEVYADEGISGTSTRKREGFNRMVADAKAGKIDLILTKSISRFARNTVDAITTARDLKEHNVEIRFEKENINSFDPKAEMAYTILSSLAQEESRSISENVRWGQQKSMREGKVHVAYSRFLGYEKGLDGKMQIVEEEAKTVRWIYGMFLDEDKTLSSIARELTANGIKTPAGKDVWAVSTIRSILSNEKYKGEALLQKTYTKDFLSKVVKKNEGELPQVYVKHSHPAIIEPDRFELTQSKLKKHSENRLKVSNNSPFTTRVICGDCGGFFGHKKQREKDVWYCNQRFAGDHVCETPVIPEFKLRAAFAEALRQELGRMIAENRPRALDMAEEAALAARLLKAQETAENAHDAAVAELKKLTDDNARRSQDQTIYRERHEKLMEKAEIHKKALVEAKDAVLENAARRERMKRFFTATENLTLENIEFTDSLFIATCERIVASKKKPDVTYSLEFYLANGDKIKLSET